MSKKYIKQIDNPNFLYPNNYLAEYDVTIIHDLNENSVSGIVTGFTTSLSADKKSLTISYDYEWIRNSAEVYVMSDGSIALTSFHLSQGTSFYKPTQLLWFTNVTGATPNNYYESVSVTETYDSPDQIWTEGDYYYEIRFIGHRAIFPIQGKFTLTYPAPTPTPTPTPTQTPGLPPSTPTPTPTPSSTPASISGITVQLGTTIDLCGTTPITCYTATNDIRTGVILYYNSGLTAVVTGYNYVSSYDYGEILNINSTTGLIGGHTSYNC